MVDPELCIDVLGGAHCFDVAPQNPSSSSLGLAQRIEREAFASQHSDSEDGFEAQ